MLAATVALLITMFAMPKTAQAADNYGFHVGNVYVTPDNCHNITGSNIKPYDENTTDNKVWYEPGTNTLYIRNTRIERTGGSNRCIRNEKNDGLTIVFIGNNYFYSKNSEAICLESNTTLKGGKTNPRPEIFAGSYEYEGIYVENKSKVTIEDLYIMTSSHKNHSILGEVKEELKLKNVYIFCLGTGDNKAVVANFKVLSIENSHISISESFKKTYGIRVESSRCTKENDYEYPDIYIGGTCTIKTIYPAIHVNGWVDINGKKNSKLEATSSADCAMYVDWIIAKDDLLNKALCSGMVYLYYTNFTFKGLSSGIRGNRYENRKRPEVTIKNATGVIEATEPGSGLITNLEEFILEDCNIQEPYGAYFDTGKHALCDINGNIITDKVRIENKWSADVEGVRTDEPAAVSEIYSPDGRRQNEMKRGLNIVRMTDGTAKKVIVK